VIVWHVLDGPERDVTIRAQRDRRFHWFKLLWDYFNAHQAY